MDSLLIVLIVIGVVMILGGVARMRSKRRHGWDEIDHSVLFSKTEPDDDVISAPRPVDSVRTKRRDINDDTLQTAENPGPILADVDEVSTIDKADAFSITLDADEQRDQDSGQQSSASRRARSILGKIKGEHTAPDIEPKVTTQIQKTYKSGAPDKVIVLNVMASHGRHFTGLTLVEAIQSRGMRYGDMQIFHYEDDGETWFSLANMVQPGHFDLDDIEALSTPGVSLFVQIPNLRGKGLEAFNTMLATAQQLAKQLGGELRDDTRSVLTSSAIDLIRQQIAEYDCKWLVSA